jgi:hypothetical protein
VGERGRNADKSAVNSVFAMTKTQTMTVTSQAAIAPRDEENDKEPAVTAHPR